VIEPTISWDDSLLGTGSYLDVFKRGFEFFFDLASLLLGSRIGSSPLEADSTYGF